VHAYIIERTLIHGRSKPKNFHSHEQHQPMNRRLRFEFYVIIIRESPFPKYLELEVEKTARVLCMTPLSGYGKSTKASRTSLRLKLAMSKEFGRATLETDYISS